MEDALNDNFIQNMKIINSNILSTVSNADYITYLHELPLEESSLNILNKVKKQYEELGNIEFPLSSYQDKSKEMQIYIIDTNNTIIATTDTNDLGLDFSDYPIFLKYLDKIRTSKSFTTSRVNLSILEGEMKKFCYLSSDDGKYIFETGTTMNRDITFGNSIGLDNFEDEIMEDNQTIRSVILYDYTGVSYQKNKQKVNHTIEEAQKVYFEKALATLNTIEVQKKISGEDLFYYYIPYEIIGAEGINERNVIEVVYSSADMNMQLSNSIWVIILLAVFGSLIAGSLGVIRARTITKPIEEISEGVKQIGEGNFDFKVSVSCNDEFSVLAYQFGKMTNEIKELLALREENLNALEYKNIEISEQKEEIESLYEETISINEELENLLRKNRVSYFETVRALANSIEEKDRYTGGHCERVMEYSMKIAEELKLGEDEKNDLKFGSIIHDIGKIGIPEYILHKDDKLTIEEYKIIKTHPEIGHRILKDLDFLNHSKNIVYEHHERIDGKGYPRGLKGDEIHFLAKIVCVADAYDAMTSNRPYRMVMTTEDAIKELLANAGTQFDAGIVDAFIKTIYAKT